MTQEADPAEPDYRAADRGKDDAKVLAHSLMQCQARWPLFKNSFYLTFQKW